MKDKPSASKTIYEYVRSNGGRMKARDVEGFYSTARGRDAGRALSYLKGMGIAEVKYGIVTLTHPDLAYAAAIRAEKKDNRSTRKWMSPAFPVIESYVAGMKGDFHLREVHERMMEDGRDIPVNVVRALVPWMDGVVCVKTTKPKVYRVIGNRKE